MLTIRCPRLLAGPKGWWYVFGSGAMTLLMIQIVTGIGLALVYVPAADQAYDSLLFLNYDATARLVSRGPCITTPGQEWWCWSVVHMTQVFLHGAYKYPRELTWIVGVVLLLCTLGMFFSGQILRWDPDAYWGLAVAGSMAGRVPVLGPWMVELVLGGPVIGGNSLSRFFSLHVFVIPGLLLLFLAIHLWLVIRRGVSAPPVPGEKVDPKTYDAQYHEELKTGVPFLGEAMRKDVIFSALAVIVVVVLAAVLGPKGPGGPPNPTLGGANPRPEWPFLWLFGLLSLSPAAAETFIILVFPVILILAPASRPVHIQSRRTGPEPPAAGGAARGGVLDGLRRPDLRGDHRSLVAADDGLERRSDPGGPGQESSPRQLQGAVVFQNKNCRNCHALAGADGLAVGGKEART